MRSPTVVGSPFERFWPKVQFTDSCWLWTASLNTHGYAQLGAKTGERPFSVHRWAYEFFVGPIPDGLQIDHLCRVRRCVNPDHLEPVTLKENLLRGMGISALEARQTHCKRGHPLSGDNLMARKPRTPDARTRRRCKTCHREEMRKKVAP